MSVDVRKGHGMQINQKMQKIKAPECYGMLWT